MHADPIDEVLLQLNNLMRAVLALRGTAQTLVAPHVEVTRNVSVTPRVTVAGDILRGASAIAIFLYGEPKERRKIYHLAATGRLPTFNEGAIVCGRKSVLMERIKAQEARGHGGVNET